MSDPLLDQLAARYPDLAPCLPDLQLALTRLGDVFAGDGTLLVCGNGGSAADSEHVVGELMKGFALPRPVPEEVRRRLRDTDPVGGGGLADQLQGALRAISLVSQTSLTTAIANDGDADMVFAQQVYGYGRPGDGLLAISTSGSSRNVVNALRVARAQGLCTVGLTGRSGGAMQTLCDVVVRVPYDDTPTIQERHLAIYHALCLTLELRFFGP